jgi:DNA-binding transcriptional ArsR family regulator
VPCALVFRDVQEVLYDLAGGRSVLGVEEIKVVTAIHHPTRRRIVDHLVLHEPAQVTAIARALDLQVGSVSHHLRMLRKAGVVEQVRDSDGDGRTSWWRMARTRFSWSVEDFASPAEQLQAREAERANVTNQLQHLKRWYDRKQDDDTDWPRAAFSSDSLAWATSDELAELDGLLKETLDRWRDSIDTADGQTRSPVFFFAHGFPTGPEARE